MVGGAADFLVAAWDAVAAEPKLQVMVVGVVLLVLAGWGLNSVTRRIR
jgi:hypothetical protein